MVSSIIKTILKFRQLLGIAPNEPISIYAINRSLQMLNDNDTALSQYLLENKVDETVQFWQSTCSYKKNQFVVYVEDVANQEEANVFILLSLIDNNQNRPIWEPDVNGLPDFDNSGWRMIHNVSYLFQDKNLLYSKVLKPQMENAFTKHLINAHGGLNVSSESDLAGIFVKKDFTNTKTDPLKTDGFVSFVDSDTANGIIKRIVHKHTSGVLEEWITFSFSNYVNQYITIEDDKYFHQKNSMFDVDDATIFSRFFYADDRKLTDLHMKHNLDTPIWYDVKLGTNIFSREINFGDFGFVNDEYMIFTGTYTEDQFVFAESFEAIQDASLYTPGQFVSEIMFVNKKPNSMTAILPIHTYFNSYGAYKVGTIWKNQFTIHLVGIYR